MNSRMEDWDAGDFYREFHKAAVSSPDGEFRRRFEGLAKAVEPLDREFLRETIRCGRDLSATMAELESIAEGMGQCGGDCGPVYDDVDRAVSRIEQLREGCFL